MKILLSSIGSRGDVQPVLALALELRAHGHEPRLCVAPNFKDWIESHGLACIPIGPDLRRLTGGTAPKQPPPPPLAPPSPEQRRALAGQTVRSQFPVLLDAARGCELVIGAGALQLATRSVTEALGIRYVFAAYCPVVLPSPDHPPPKFGVHHPLTLTAEENLALWAEEERSWNDLFGAALNEERAKLGLPPVDSALRHVLTERPWLASDPVLGPAGAGELRIRQTGAWLLRDRTPLPGAVERFLADGAPPVYLGFGSMRATDETSRILVEAVRALGLRSILSQGWAELAPADAAGDCLSIGDVAHEVLFPRVAAVVHHGGAGTTTTAARAGTPQVIVPHNYDQPYWAHRVAALGVGARGPASERLSVEAIVTALRTCLQPETAARAQALAARVQPDGARAAAELLGAA
jgi:vancomycin aglycone glucosyltransferase